MEDVGSGAQFAATLDECGRLCDQHNAVLRGTTDQPAYGFNHCNAVVYDERRKLCSLKNKRMGNFHPTGTRDGDVYAAYRWNALTNEVNDTFPNRTSGMQYNPLPARVAWSHDSSENGVNVLVDPHGTPHTSHNRMMAFDVRPGAIFTSHQVQDTRTFWAPSMQECATAVAQVPYANAFTFRPDYTSQSALQPIVAGQCMVGTVREPYYDTLTEEDNGSISGFSIGALAPTIRRFLFG